MAATIMSLLPIICCEYQEVKLITQLNSFFNFDHNILLIDLSVDINRFINTRSQKNYTPQSLYVFCSSNNKISGLESLTEIKTKNTFMIIVPESSNFDSNLKLLDRLKEIQKFQINMKIGFFFQKFATRDNLEKLFQWCKNHLIVNIFAATYSHPEVIQGLSADRMLNIFTFNPFGKFYVINVTGSESYKSFFASINSNFQQHELRVRPPIYGPFWPTVFLLMNATFVLVEDNNDTTSNDNELDVFAQLYSQKELTQFIVYPVRMAPQVIIVPEALQYSAFAAFMRTVTSDTFFVYSLITAASLTLLLSFFRYMTQKKNLFFQSFVDVLNLLMNDNLNIKYQRLSRMEVFLIVPLTFFGFVVVNGFLSNLQSYLTRPILQPQLDTIEDIYRSSLPILTWEEFWVGDIFDVFTKSTNYEGWNDRIFLMESSKFDDQITSFNRSISFLLDLPYADTLLRVQKRLKIKGYHNPRIQISNELFTFVVNDKFLFFERLNEIIHWMRNVGLYDLWYRQYYDHLENEILKENIERLKNQKDTHVEKLPVPIFIVYGWLASLIVFVIEIIWKKFTISHMKTLFTDKFIHLSQQNFRLRLTQRIKDYFSSDHLDHV